MNSKTTSDGLGRRKNLLSHTSPVEKGAIPLLLLGKWPDHGLYDCF
jgi:hypothetical protein